jgi:hypothetical protein
VAAELLVSSKGMFYIVPSSFRCLTTVTVHFDSSVLSRSLMKYLAVQGIALSGWEKNWLVNL